MTRPQRWAWFGLPLFVFYVLAFVVPQGAFLLDSLYLPAGRAMLGAGPTLTNYANVLSDEYYLQAIGFSLLTALAVATCGLILALPLAFYIAHSRSRLGFLVLVIVVSMLFTNAVIRTLGWRLLLSTVGPLNQFLLQLGLISTPLELLDSYTGVIIGLVHALLPIYVMALVPICEAVPRNLLNVAEGLGASRWHTFWTVVFPLIRGGLITSALLIFATSIGTFTTPALLGGGRVLLLPILIRERVLMMLNWPIGATLAAVLTAVVLTIAALVASRSSAQARKGSA